MNRNINLIFPNSNNKPIEGFTDISVDNLNEIFDMSVNSIYCSITSFINNDSVIKFLDLIFQKLIPGGQLFLVVYDLRKICRLFVDNSLDIKSFFDILKNINNTLDIDTVINICKQRSLSCVDMKQDNFVNYITIIKSNNNG